MMPAHSSVQFPRWCNPSGAGARKAAVALSCTRRSSGRRPSRGTCWTGTGSPRRGGRTCRCCRSHGAGGARAVPGPQGLPCRRRLRPRPRHDLVAGVTSRARGGGRSPSVTCRSLRQTRRPGPEAAVSPPWPRSFVRRVQAQSGGLWTVPAPRRARLASGHRLRPVACARFHPGWFLRSTPPGRRAAPGSRVTLPLGGASPRYVPKTTVPLPGRRRAKSLRAGVGCRAP